MPVVRGLLSLVDIILRLTNALPMVWCCCIKASCSKKNTAHKRIRKIAASHKLSSSSCPKTDIKEGSIYTNPPINSPIKTSMSIMLASNLRRIMSTLPYNVYSVLYSYFHLLNAYKFANRWNVVFHI